MKNEPPSTIKHNIIPYQLQVSINSKPVLTGFGITLSKKSHGWQSTTTMPYDIAMNIEVNKTSTD
jgi:hypothetical protein